MDEVEIANLLYQYAEYVDSGNLEALADLFAYARIKLGEGVPLATSQDLLALWRRKIIIYPDGTPRTKHVVTNPIIHVDQGANTATSRSYYTVIQGLEDFPLQIIASGRYYDAFERVEGRWRFSFRDYSLLDIPGDLSRHNHGFEPSRRAFGAVPWTLPVPPGAKRRR